MKDYTEAITKVIKELGILANIKGYYYIRYAVELVMNDITVTDSFMKRVYPTVAKQFNTTASRAERAIRHAITVSWNRTNVEFIEKVFGYGIDANRGTPTNSEFIATVADYILMQERKTEKGSGI